MISHAFKLMGGCALLVAVFTLIIVGLFSKPVFLAGVLIFTWAGIASLWYIGGKAVLEALGELDV